MRNRPVSLNCIKLHETVHVVAKLAVPLSKKWGTNPRSALESTKVSGTNPRNGRLWRKTNPRSPLESVRAGFEPSSLGNEPKGRELRQVAVNESRE